MRFYNVLTYTAETECAKQYTTPTKPGWGVRGRWYIERGFAGWTGNVANLTSGYVSKATAERACLRYQRLAQKEVYGWYA